MTIYKIKNLEEIVRSFSKWDYQVIKEISYRQKYKYESFKNKDGFSYIFSKIEGKWVTIYFPYKVKNYLNYSPLWLLINSTIIYEI